MSKRPASSSATPKYTKRKKKTFSLEEKVKILDELSAGAGSSTLGRKYCVNESTICSIKKNETKFRRAYAQPEFKNSTLHIREPTYKKMEEALKIWIEDMEMRKGFLTGPMIRQQALEIQEQLLVKEGKSSSEMKFTASQGWLHNFIGRIGLKHVKMHGEAGSADYAAAEQAKLDLKQKVEEGGYTPDQVWNCDETGLVWKKMPEITYMMKSEGKRPGNTKDKNRITLLLCSNASGTARMKPVLVHTAARPRVFKNVDMSRLPVHWRSSYNAWMTSQIFTQWYLNQCIPFIEHHNKVNNLPNKALLILDNATVHPKDLDEKHKTIKLMFLPPKVTSLVQPLDQGVIAVLKRLYLKESLKQMVDAMKKDLQLTAPEFYKTFTIKDAMMNAVASWNSIENHSLNGIWRSLWPEVVNDFKGFEKQKEKAVREFIQLGKEVRDDPGFQNLNVDDVEELVASMDEVMSVADAIEIAEEKKTRDDDDKDDDDDNSKDEEEPPRKEWSIPALQSFMSCLQDALQIVKDNDPDLERVIQKVESVRRFSSDYKTLLDRKICEQQQRSIKSYFKPSPVHAVNAEMVASRPSATKPPAVRKLVSDFFKPLSVGAGLRGGTSADELGEGGEPAGVTTRVKSSPEGDAESEESIDDELESSDELMELPEDSDCCR